VKSLAQAVLIVFIIFSLQKLTHAEAAVGFVKYPLNPILNIDLTKWDINNVDAPYVLKLNNIYKAWYSGTGLDGWNIGYATSSSGLSDWTRSSQIILQPGSDDGWEQEAYDSFVIYDLNNSIYKMWYTSMNSSHWPSGLDRFRTRYATSKDGINWTKFNWVMTGTPGTWDEGGTARGRSIIYKNGVYHMWYAATNSNDLTTSPFWRIGYATSTDGIFWVKQNDGSPVLNPTTPWELNTISFPYVRDINGVYHMWYGASLGDVATQIVYAYSYDGINWIKPPDHNPVLTSSPGTFDQVAVFPSSIIMEDNILKMWYSGSDGTHWRIGYATASADWLPKMTPPQTPTPSPTLTLTPTPSPTPTPTPHPTPTKKVILIPGMTSRTLFNAQHHQTLRGHSLAQHTTFIILSSDGCGKMVGHQ